MRSRLALTTAIILTCAGSPSWALSQPTKWSLVDARLVDVKDIRAEPGAPRICIDDQAAVCLDGSWRVKYSIRKTLAGPSIAGSVREDIASAQPRRNLRFLLVVSNDNGQRQIEWRGLYQFGLCIDGVQSSRFGLSDAIVRFPCRK